jgi:3-methyladenine DNA glycosylase AlkC
MTVANDKSITKWFGENLAELLAKKIKVFYKNFDSKAYYNTIKLECEDLSYTKRISLHASALKNFLPKSYPKAIEILIRSLGDENPNETGMFRNFYWVMPIGKFIEEYGLEDFDISIKAIEEITKRSTGEYAIRPFIRKYPQKTILIMQEWARSPNFHLRRLASEGSRPKLPWATKLNTFIENPDPVFKILEVLIEDNIKFVQKSVSNNLIDYLKVNKKSAIQFIEKFGTSDNKNTQWILKNASKKTRIPFVNGTFLIHS